MVGVGGHAYKQISDDKQDDHLVGDGNRGSTFSIGPAVQYASKGGWFLSAKWQDESGVRNRPEGQTYWLKFTVPL
ncbi:putative MetA-pathway of phenol degradation [compost metagenome]